MAKRGVKSIYISGEEAVEQIAEKIKAGDLHTGDRLPSERELAAQMRISRPTLREALALWRGPALADLADALREMLSGPKLISNATNSADGNRAETRLDLYASLR